MRTNQQKKNFKQKYDGVSQRPKNKIRKESNSLKGSKEIITTESLNNHSAFVSF